MDVHNFHRNTNGWLGIAYNFFCTFNGEIIQGRGFNEGAGVLGQNHHTIHIGCQGDFEKQVPTENQIKSVIELCKYIQKEIPNAKQVVGHSFFGGSSCPGKNFPMQRVVNAVNNNTQTPQTTTSTLLRKGDKGNDVKELQQKLIELGFNLGSWGADGDFGNATDIAVKQFQKDNNLLVDGVVGENTIKKINELIELKNKPVETPKPEVKQEVKTEVKPEVKPEIKQEVKPEEKLHWKLADLKELADLGIISDFDGWSKKIDEPAPNWLVFTLINRIRKLK